MLVVPLQVDFLPVAGISQDTSNALKDAQQEAKKRTRKAKATIDGQDQLFDVSGAGPAVCGVRGAGPEVWHVGGRSICLAC